MVRYTAGRLLQAAIILIGVITIVFIVSRLTGDPTYLMVDPTATEEDIAALRESLGLDRPLLVQYWNFVGNALRGDLGTSLWQHQPATTLVLGRLPYTLALTFAALGLSLLLGIPAGVASAVFRNRFADRLIMALALVGQTMPGFWLGLMLMMLFALRLRWFPTSGSGTALHLVLPAVSLAAYGLGRIARMTRSAMLEVLSQDYIRTARAKGVSGLNIYLKHALRNAAIPIVTLLGLDISAMLGGAVITETVFAWPGLGRLLTQAIGQRDFPLIQAAVLFLASVVVFVNLAVDLSYGLIDTRVKYE